MDLYAAIRFDWQRNQISIRGLADKYGVHRRTVPEAIDSRFRRPARARRGARRCWTRCAGAIDAILVEDSGTTRDLLEILGYDAHIAAKGVPGGRSKPATDGPVE